MARGSVLCDALAQPYDAFNHARLYYGDYTRFCNGCDGGGPTGFVRHRVNGFMDFDGRDCRTLVPLFYLFIIFCSLVVTVPEYGWHLKKWCLCTL